MESKWSQHSPHLQRSLSKYQHILFVYCLSYHTWCLFICLFIWSNAWGTKHLPAEGAVASVVVSGRCCGSQNGTSQLSLLSTDIIIIDHCRIYNVDDQLVRFSNPHYFQDTWRIWFLPHSSPIWHPGQSCNTKPHQRHQEDFCRSCDSRHACPCVFEAR